MKVRNRSKEEQAFANIPAFKPEEERDVDAPLARYLLNNPNIELVNPEDEKKVWAEEDAVLGIETQNGETIEGIETSRRSAPKRR